MTAPVPPSPVYYTNDDFYRGPESLVQEDPEEEPIEAEPKWKEVHRKTEAKLAAAHKQLIEANEQIKKNMLAQKKSLEEIEKIKNEQISKSETAKKQTLSDLESIVPSFIQTGDLQQRVNSLVAQAQAKIDVATHSFEKLFKHSSLMQGRTDTDSRDEVGSSASQSLEGQVDDSSIASSFVELGSFNPSQIQKRIDQAVAEGKLAAAHGEEEIARLSTKMNEQLDQLKSMSMLEKQTIDVDNSKIQRLDKLRALLDDPIDKQ